MPIVVADSHIAYRNDRTNKYEMHYSLNTHTLSHLMKQTLLAWSLLSRYRTMKLGVNFEKERHVTGIKPDNKIPSRQ